MESSQSDHLKKAATQAPAWIAFIYRCNCYFMFDLFGGPRIFTAKTILNIHCSLQIFVMSFWMWHYAPTSPAAWVLFGMAAANDVLWLIKNTFFPDASWEHKATLPSNVFFVFYLFSTWVMAWLLISGFSNPTYPLPENLWVASCVAIYAIGIVIKVASDAQKNLLLKAKPGLITDGMYRLVRHPNYLGQTLIYLGLILMAWHWISTLIFVAIFFSVFLVNMIMKEASMSRYPQWAAYRKKSWWLIPGVF